MLIAEWMGHCFSVYFVEARSWFWGLSNSSQSGSIASHQRPNTVAIEATWLLLVHNLCENPLPDLTGTSLPGTQCRETSRSNVVGCVSHRSQHCRIFGRDFNSFGLKSPSNAVVFANLQSFIRSKVGAKATWAHQAKGPSLKATVAWQVVAPAWKKFFLPKSISWVEYVPTEHRQSTL